MLACLVWFCTSLIRLAVEGTIRIYYATAVEVKKERKKKENKRKKEKERKKESYYSDFDVLQTAQCLRGKGRKKERERKKERKRKRERKEEKKKERKKERKLVLGF